MSSSAERQRLCPRSLCLHWVSEHLLSCFYRTPTLLYGCTTWTLTKRLKKKLDGNYTRLLRAILNKSWRQHPTRHHLYGHLPPITKTIQVRRARHAGHSWRSKDELISDVLLWTPAYGQAKAGRPSRTYIQQLYEDTGCSLKTCQKRWMMGRGGERGSGISVLVARMMVMMIIAVTVSLGRPCTKSNYFIFPLCMESNALEKSTNKCVTSKFFALTLSMIRRIVRIFDVVDWFLQKLFWFFLRIFSICGSM